MAPKAGATSGKGLRGALTTLTVTHYDAATETAQVGDPLRSIDGYEGQGMTKSALQLAPHVFARAGGRSGHCFIEIPSGFALRRRQEGRDVVVM